MNGLQRVHERARAARRHVVLPEGTEPRTVQAASAAAAAGIARVSLLGRREEVLAVARETGADLGAVEIAAPPDAREAALALRAYLDRVRRRGIPPDRARPSCWWTGRCRPTPRSCPRSRPPRPPGAPWEAGRTSSCFPTSTRATSATSSWSASRAPARWGRCCRGWSGP